MRSVPLFKYSHIELAHKSGIHFDCIVDATSLRPCVVPPLLTGEHTYYEDVLLQFTNLANFVCVH